MGLIPESVLDEIQSRADIAELIGRYVPLKRAGRHFKALCPFHKERTPSFHINTDKQIFHCFGCGVGGGIFSFLMQQERLTFPEAVRQVAEQVGVMIPEQADGPHTGQRDALLTILEKAARYYEGMLTQAQLGQAAREYLKRRGVTDQTRQTFRLGYAPDGGAHLIQAAKKSQISDEALERAGLIVQGRRGPTDRFRQRLLFPIQDARGRVIGFGGRSLGDQEPKYLNSPETAVYIKGHHLFGLAQAKDAIVKAKQAVVVEGYFDCVCLWQAGFAQTVSPLGTAFTPDQAKLLSRYSDRVVLAFDADAAGETATLRGIDILLEHGLHVTVAQLPAGVDPDEFVQRYGTQAFQGVLDQAQDVVECLLACAGRRYNLRSADDKIRAAQTILSTVARVPNAMLRAEYIRLLSERLHVDERAMRQELGKVKAPPGDRTQRPPQREPVAKFGRGGQTPEQLFAALILDRPERWDTLKGEITLDLIGDEPLRRVLALICELRAAGRGEPTPAQLIVRLGDEQGALVSELVERARNEPAKDEAFRKCIQRIKLEAREREQHHLRDQIRVAQALGREEELTRLLTNYQQLVKTHVPVGKEG